MQPESSHQNSDNLDAAAVGQTQMGNASAFEEIVRRYTPLAYSLTYRLLGADREAAEEAVQEIFLKVYRSLGRFDARKRFFTWFYTITLNHLRSERRRRHAHPEEAPVSIDEALFVPAHPNEETQPEAHAVAREGERLAQEALLLLPEQYREVFLLRHVEGLSSREVAEILHLPEATVRTHLFRAREQLKRSLLERQWE